MYRGIYLNRGQVAARCRQGASGTGVSCGMCVRCMLLRERCMLHFALVGVACCIGSRCMLHRLALHVASERVASERGASERVASEHVASMRVASSHRYALSVASARGIVTLARIASVHRCESYVASVRVAHCIEWQCDPPGAQTNGGGGGVLFMAKGTALFDAVAIAGTMAQVCSAGQRCEPGRMRSGERVSADGVRRPIVGDMAASAVRRMAAWCAWATGPSRSRTARSRTPWRCACAPVAFAHAASRVANTRAVRCIAAMHHSTNDTALREGGLPVASATYNARRCNVPRSPMQRAHRIPHDTTGVAQLCCTPSPYRQLLGNNCRGVTWHAPSCAVVWCVPQWPLLDWAKGGLCGGRAAVRSTWCTD
jgi:hypothetical protein